jgi:ABC-type multidrug transport system ATPase subunit
MDAPAPRPSGLRQPFSSPFSLYASQTTALLKKNVRLLLASPLTLTLILLLPSLIALAQYAYRVRPVNLTATVHPDRIAAPTLPSCLVFAAADSAVGEGQVIPGASCFNFVFAPASDATATAIVADLRSSLGWAPETVHAFSTYADILTYAEAHPGEVGFGAVFESDLSNLSGVVEVSLLYNQTVSGGGWYGNYSSDLDPLYIASDKLVDGTLLALQSAVAASILRATDSPGDLAASGLSFSPSFQNFPNVETGLPQGYKTPSLIGTAAALVLTPIAVLMFAVSLVVGERESGRLSTLRMWGTAELLHWITWFIVLAVPYLISVVPAAYLLHGLEVEVFQWVDVSVIIANLASAGLAHIAFALLLAALLPRTSTAMITCVIIMLVGFFLAFLAMFQGTSAVFYDFSLAAFVKPLWFFIRYCLPPVSSAAAAAETYFAAAPATYGVDTTTGEMTVVGPAVNLTWAVADLSSAAYVAHDASCMFFSSHKSEALIPWYPTNADGDKDYAACLYDTKPLRDTFAKEVYAAVGLLALSWYLGVHLQAAGSAGAPLLFPLMPSWYRAWPSSAEIASSNKRCCDAVQASQVIHAAESESGEVLDASGGHFDPDVEAHVREVLMQPSAEALDTNGVVLVGVRRRFGTFRALKGLTLAMPRHTNTGLLGHNGAGKSVLFSILLGIRRPHREPAAFLRPALRRVPFLRQRFLSSDGAELFAQKDAGLDKAFVLGLDASRHMHAIRRAISICPQHNEAMLWPAMTAYQHLETYLSLRDYTDLRAQPEKRAAAVRTVLEQLDLWDVRNKRAGRFSGGMQRRLCVALALVGSPSFTLLDECSAGTDPASREMMWTALKDSLKDGRGICSISHDMSEVQVLSTQVAILSHGQLSAFGTPMRLMDRFGSGYLLEVTVRETAESPTLSASSAPAAADLAHPGVAASVSRVEQALIDVIRASPFDETDSRLMSVSSRSGHAISFRVATRIEALIPNLMRAVSDGGPVGDIVVHRTLTQSTLDEVFLALAEKEEALAIQRSLAAKKRRNANRHTRRGSRRAAPAVIPLASSAPADVTLSSALPDEHADLEAPPAATVSLDKAFNPIKTVARPLRALVLEAAYLQLQRGFGLLLMLVLPALSMLIFNATIDLVDDLGQMLSGAVSSSKETLQATCASCLTEHVGDTAYCYDYELPFPGLSGDDYLSSACSYYHFLAADEPVSPPAVDLTSFGTCLWPRNPGVPQIQIIDLTGGIHSTASFLPAFAAAGAGTSGSQPLSVSDERDFDFDGLTPDDEAALEAAVTAAWTGLGLPDPFSSSPSASLARNWPLRFKEALDYSLDPASYGELVYSTTLLYSLVDGPASLDAFETNVGATMAAGWPDLPDEIMNATGYFEVYTAGQYFGVEQVFPYAGVTVPAGADLTTKDFSAIFSTPLPPDTYLARQRDLLWHSYSFPDRDDISWLLARVSIDLATSSFSFIPGLMSSTPVPWNFMSMLLSHYSTAVHRVVAANPAAEIVFKAQALPFQTHEDGYMLSGFNVAPLACLFAGILCPLAVFSLLPTLVRAPAYERFHRIRALLQISGVRASKYWLANFLFCLAIGGVVAVALTVVAYLLDISTLTRSSVLIVLGWLLLGVVAINQLAMLIGALVSSIRVASLLAAVLTAVCAIVPSIDLFSGDMLSLDMDSLTFASPWHYWFAPAAFVHGIRVFTLRSVTFSSLFATQLPLAAGVICLTTILVYLTVVYVDEVLPRKDQLALTRHPLFPLREAQALVRRARSAASKRRQGPDFDALKAVQHVAVPLQYEGAAANFLRMDEDVLAERQALADGRVPADVPLRVSNLRKVYPDGKVAVVDVAMHVRKSEIFGLLGVNGAGKSTAIACMCGLLPISEGAVSVCGHDVATDPIAATRAIGMSPQEDVFWPDLTVARTLRVFAIMKGVAPKETRAVAEAVAKFVGLDSELAKKASALSGGMRRRMTFAIALIGAPDMLALDEITAGVDPATKRLIFRAVQSAKASRGVLITTHDLDEASAISDRIAIMQAGTLRCLGSLAHLKARFGLHYKVEIQPHSALSLSSAGQPDDGFVAAADVALTAAAAAATLVDVAAATGTRKYSLPPTADVPALFQALLDAKAAGAIQSFSVSFATLRDLFLAIAREKC